MALYTPYGSKGAGSSLQGPATTEFDILKGSHKFLREDDGVDERQLSWDERLAKKYYASLYREYAVCDLKHYKSGNFALRWRTEQEVLSGAGETTCGNTRCPLHGEFPNAEDDARPALTTLELPFAYTEHGESKFALVKVVLCAKCCKKLMWKHNKEKEEQRKRTESEIQAEGSGEARTPGEETLAAEVRERRQTRSPIEDPREDRGKHTRRRHKNAEDDRGRRRGHGSRSRSPRRQNYERRRGSS